MASLTFTQKASTHGDVWVAEIQGVSGTILVDLEREKTGALVVEGKLAGASEFKFMGVVDRAHMDKDVLFNINNPSDEADMTVKIISGSEVINGKYQ